MNEALRDWVSNVSDTFYVVGRSGTSSLSNDGQRFSIYNRKTKQQIIKAENRLPDLLLACVGESNALGLFYPFS